VSLEENEIIVRKVIEAVNQKDLTILDELMAPDFVDYTNQGRGRENVKKFYSMAFKDFRDFHRTIEDITAEGDNVWIRCEITGTTSTGKKIELTSVAIYRIVNGKVAEGWGGVIQKMSVPKAAGELYDKLL
jgi:predicted ester cyclase